MQKFYFTFGFGHHQPGKLLKNHYTIIEAEDKNRAMVKMSKVRGNKWAFCYSTRESAGIDEWNLTFIDFSEVQPQDGPNI